MLQNASKLDGYAIIASDGPIGTITDLLFDDATWIVRWLIVDTGHWLSGRTVLLPPSVLGHLDSQKRECTVRLTKQQVKDSPDVRSDLPVSRQLETHVYDYYGWSPYWATSFYMGSYGYMGGSYAMSPMPGMLRSDEYVAASLQNSDDPHLRSVAEVTGYHIHATDGEIGHVQDFLVEEVDWCIHYLVVDTKNWWAGKHVLISPRSAKSVDWTERLVNLDVPRQKVRDSPVYDASVSVDRPYERHFYDYYGDVRAFESS